MFYLSALRRRHSLGDASAPRNVTAVPGCGTWSQFPWKSWDGEEGLGEPTRSFLLQVPDNPKSECLDKPRALSSALQVQLFTGVCVLSEGGASKIPFRPLCTLYLGEHKSAKNSCTFLHPSLTSPYETFRKLLKTQAQPQKYSEKSSPPPQQPEHPCSKHCPSSRAATNTQYQSKHGSLSPTGNAAGSGSPKCPGHLSLHPLMALQSIRG